MLVAIGLILMLVSVVTYIMLETVILPQRMIKSSFRIKEPHDRGVKRCLFKGKRCIVYKSGNSNKKYIQQYAIIQDEGKKLLKCKVSPAVEYIDYDIVLFDRCNKPFKVMNVKEDILGVDYTRSTVIPNETSYVTLVIKRVNKTVFKRPPCVKVKGGSIFGFGLVTILLTAIEGYIIRACCSISFGGVFRESFIATTKGLIVIGALAIVCGILAMIIAGAGARSRARH